MKLLGNEKLLKITYKILTVLLSICWAIMACWGLFTFVKVKYLYPLSFKEEIIEYADYYGHDRALIFAVVKTESGFDKNAVSSAGAIGLMQITEKTGKYIAQRLGVENYDLNDVETNLDFGCFYIKYLILRFENLDTALIAYNAGEGNVALWLQNKEYSTDKKTLINIPFSETNEYIKKIHENFSKYKKIYGKFLDKV